MTAKARIDIDVVYQTGTAKSVTLDYLSEHTSADVSSVMSAAGTVGTTLVTIQGVPPLSTLAVKNTGSSTIRLAGTIDVPAGRLAVLPVTATITVSAPSGIGAYSSIWVG